MSSVVSGRNKFKQNTEMVITYIYICSLYLYSRIKDLHICSHSLNQILLFHLFVREGGKGTQGNPGNIY